MQLNIFKFLELIGTSIQKGGEADPCRLLLSKTLAYMSIHKKIK